MNRLKPLSFGCKLRLCAAILVAALWTDIFDPAAYRRIWRALSLWWGAMDNGTRVDEEEYDRRIRICEGCPLFYWPLRTCGSPLSKTLRGMGCSCQMDVKARLKDATCWLDDELGTEARWGWNSEPRRDIGAGWCCGSSRKG